MRKKGLDSVYCLNDLKVTCTVVHSKIRGLFVLRLLYPSERMSFFCFQS